MERDSREDVGVMRRQAGMGEDQGAGGICRRDWGHVGCRWHLQEGSEDGGACGIHRRDQGHGGADGICGRDWED